jgi:DNA-binding GntR family transcriptional regulator
VTANNRRVDIDPNSPEPKFRQLADILRGRIETGLYPPGTPIPSLKRIEQETGLATMTIRKGIALLVVEGWVVPVPGKGTFVNPPESWPSG